MKNKKYPWGDSPPSDQCNSQADLSQHERYIYHQGRGIVPVNTYNPNKFELYNTVGNVAEMCIDTFSMTLPSGTDPLGVTDRKPTKYTWQFIVKGGSWLQSSDHMMIGLREMSIGLAGAMSERDFYYSDVGFRPVRFAD
jgi:formylglycine-generating enzyme required for sulfatase activity